MLIHFAYLTYFVDRFRFNNNIKIIQKWEAKMAKVAVILAGSGVYDGSELHEAVLTLLHLDEKDAKVQCFAPDKAQMHVINHAKGEPSEGEERNVLVEAARISRGDIQPLSKGQTDDYDALIVPGGFGVAKNLCDFAVKGADCDVEPGLERALLEFHEAGKPVGCLCIAPVAAAKAFGSRGIKVKLTIGNDPDTSAAINTMGAEHVNCPVDDIVVDEENKIVTTPAYMLGPSIAQVNKGIAKLVDKVISMC